MGSPSSTNTPSLLTLPPHILTRILSYLRDDIDPDPDRELHPFNFPPVHHSLSLQKCLTIPLPSVLLPIATVSPVLALAAARVTGAQHTYLTPQTTGYQLHCWVRALAPFVKAVAADDYILESLVDFTGPVRDSMYNNIFSDSLQLFDALSTNLAKLEVLDLIHLPFHIHNMDDALLTALHTTLESNGATLRELALPAYAKSDICARALELTTLRHLEVFTVDLRDKPTKRSAYAKCSPMFRMLQALDGHADRALGITKVRDLRLMNDSGTLRHEARSGLSKSFFQSVQILRLTTVPELYPGFYKPLLRLFPHLECLYWNDMPRSALSHLFGTCASSPEVHICNARWFTLPQLGTEEVDDYVESRRHKLLFSFHLYGPFLRTIAACCMLRPYDVADLSRKCPNLENLSLVLSSQNVRKLRSLLRRCSQMRVLEFVLDEDFSGQLEHDAWYTIAKAVRASKSLSQFAILIRDDNARFVTFINAVVNCCVAAVESLGSRARRLAFRIALSPRKFAPICNGVTKILNACKSHTPALEFLKVDLLGPRFLQQDPDIVESERTRQEFVCAKEDLLRKIRSLRGLEFGFLNQVFENCVLRSRKREALKLV